MLVPRLYDVTEGAVRIDGRDVRDLTQDSLRQAIGVVSQDPHMFHESIGANLRYGRPEATDDAVMAAADDAQLRGLVASLPHGLSPLVGDPPPHTSGGAKPPPAPHPHPLTEPPI